MSRVSFTTEKLENYNWNFLDHYICTRGDTDFPLAEVNKFQSSNYFRKKIHVIQVPGTLSELEILAFSGLPTAAFMECKCNEKNNGRFRTL